MKTAKVTLNGVEKTLKYPVSSTIKSNKAFNFKPLAWLAKMNENEMKMENLDEEDLMKLTWTGLIWNEPNLNYDELCENVSFSELIDLIGPIIDCLAGDISSKKPV